jgi:hypothetical protein
MTASPPPPWVPPPPRRRGAGRIAALVVGIVLLLPGLGLLAGGGALLWADGSQRDSHGYLTSSDETFSSAGYALVSRQVNLSTGADWVPFSQTLGTARLHVTGDNGSNVFIGIAPVADATAYLDGVRRTVVDDIGQDIGNSGQRQVDGTAPAGPPGDESFWVAQASGTGQQQLTWNPARGNWMLVVMNTDASAGVSVTADIGATLPSLDGWGWGLVIAGAVVMIIAVALIVLGARRPRRPAGPVAGPPAQAWAAPAPRAPSDAESARTEASRRETDS